MPQLTLAWRARRALSSVALAMLRTQARIDPQARDALCRGGALVIANHVSLLDGVLIALASPAPLMFAVDTDYSRRSRGAAAGMALLARLGFGQVLPLDAGAPFGLRALRRQLQLGGNAMVFPEGAIAFAGKALPHRPGAEWLAAAAESIVSVHIDGAGQSRVFARGNLWWPRIQLAFGAATVSGEVAARRGAVKMDTSPRFGEDVVSRHSDDCSAQGRSDHSSGGPDRRGGLCSSDVGGIGSPHR